MNDLPVDPKSTPEPETLSEEHPSIRKSQEEFIGDSAGPSIDKSEYERKKTGDGTDESGPDAKP